MRIGMAVSAALHAVLIVLAIFGLPHLFDAEELGERTIVVDIFIVAEETTPRPPPKPEPPKPEPEPKVAAQVEPRPEPEAIKPPPPEPLKPEPVKAEPPPPPPCG